MTNKSVHWLTCACHEIKINYDCNVNLQICESHLKIKLSPYILFTFDKIKLRKENLLPSHPFDSTVDEPIFKFVRASP